MVATAQAGRRPAGLLRDQARSLRTLSGHLHADCRNQTVVVESQHPAQSTRTASMPTPSRLHPKALVRPVIRPTRLTAATSAQQGVAVGQTSLLTPHSR